MALEEGDIVLCTVDRIVGTTVFVKIEGEDSEGSIITAEIAPGRIRNLRDYVIPKKKIVCKILRVQGKNIELSLRRVTSKKKKKAVVKKEFGLRTAKSNGLILIKELLEKIKDAEIKYLAAGKYSISTE